MGRDFKTSSSNVPEFDDPLVREVVQRPHRIVYRLVGDSEVHVLTVHHSSRSFPARV